MNNKEMKTLIKRARKIAKPFQVTNDRFRLKDIDPADTLDLTSEDKPRAKEALLERASHGLEGAGLHHRGAAWASHHRIRLLREHVEVGDVPQGRADHLLPRGAA